MGGWGSALGLLLAVATSASALACGGGQAAVKPSPPAPRSAATPAASPTDRCASLKARAPGIEACPPASLAFATPRASHDASLSDEDARRMAQGAARSYAIYNWAVNQGYDGFIKAGLLSYPRPDVVKLSFGEDLVGIEAARRSHTTYRLDPPLRLDAVRAVGLPPEARQDAAKLGAEAGTTALVFRLVGPYGEYLGDRVTQSRPPDYVHPILVYGELRNDPDLQGWIWYWGGYAQCSLPPTRRLCDA
jgi:hypothetical protein